MLTTDGFAVDPWLPYTPHRTYGGAEEREDIHNYSWHVLVFSLAEMKL
jgi:hypothetical protein